jgi:putative nucleotidyltransferase with HDIG domain
MWRFDRKIRRRADVRRHSVTGSLWLRFRNAGGVGSVALVAAFFALVVVLDSWPVDPLPYRLGQYVAQDIRSRVQFKHLLREKLNQEQDDAQKQVSPTLVPNTALLDEVSSTLASLPEKMKSSATTQPAIDDDMRKAFGLSTPEDLQKLQAALADAAGLAKYQQDVAKLRSSLPDQVILLDADHVRLLQQKQASDLKLLLPGGVKTKPMHDAIDLESPKPEDRQKDLDRQKNAIAQAASVFDASIRPYIEAYLQSQIIGAKRPTCQLDVDATSQEIQQARQKLAQAPPPEAYQVYAPGDVIVHATRSMLGQPAGAEAAAGGGQEGLTAAQMGLLAEERARYHASVLARKPWRSWEQVIGRSVVLLLLTVLLCLYVKRYRSQLVRNYWRGLALAMTLLAMLAAIKGVSYATGWNEHWAVGVVLLAAITLTVGFDQRFALVTGTVLSLLAVLQMRQDVALLVVMLSSLTASVFLLRDVRTRSKLVIVSLITGAIIFTVTAANGLYDAKPWRFILVDGLWGAGAAVFVGLLVNAALPLVERVFRVATSMTLLEWADSSKPLLKRLAMEAPGTYNHCLQLGTMCEAAAETIGARGLLARVGAYYHDVGKINKPAYFVENQAGGSSKHQRLSPAMSLLIITSHVKDGLELARQYHLPATLHEFIATHHGTTLVQYFYQVAADRKGESDRAPQEVEFRYPGPKPRTKEAAILMLADASESSVRSMAEPTPGRIENQVHTMVMRRLMDGQLDDCDLTLREVRQIEESLIKTLNAIYHTRVGYPTPPGQRPSAAELHKREVPAVPSPATPGTPIS